MLRNFFKGMRRWYGGWAMVGWSKKGKGPKDFGDMKMVDCGCEEGR